jgi:Tfp pilus assembly protein PilF
MLTALRFLNSVNSTAVYTAVELTLMLRILHELGYVSPKEPFGDFLGGDFTPESLLPESFPKEAVLEEIRKAVEESQL